MQCRAAITLAYSKQVDKAVPMLKNIFIKDKNWKKLTRRVPVVNLLIVSDVDLKRILALQVLCYQGKILQTLFFPPEHKVSFLADEHI